MLAKNKNQLGFSMLIISTYWIGKNPIIYLIIQVDSATPGKFDDDDKM